LVFLAVLEEDLAGFWTAEEAAGAFSSLEDTDDFTLVEEVGHFALPKNPAVLVLDDSAGVFLMVADSEEGVIGIIFAVGLRTLPEVLGFGSG